MAEWDVDVVFVVPDDWSLRSSISFEPNKSVINEFVDIGGHLWWMPIDHPSKFTNATGIVLNDHFEQLEAGQSEDPTEGLEVLDRESRWL